MKSKIVSVLIGIFAFLTASQLSAQKLFEENWKGFRVGDSPDVRSTWTTFKNWTIATILEVDKKPYLRLQREVVIQRRFTVDRALEVSVRFRVDLSTRTIGGIKIITDEKVWDGSYEALVYCNQGRLSLSLFRAEGGIEGSRSAESQLDNVPLKRDWQELTFKVKPDGKTIVLEGGLNGLKTRPITDRNPFAFGKTVVGLFTYNDTQMGFGEVVVSEVAR